MRRRRSAHLRSGRQWRRRLERRGLPPQWGCARSGGSGFPASTRAIAACWLGKLAEILNDQRPSRKVAAMFIGMAFGSPIYERLRALGHNDVLK